MIVIQVLLKDILLSDLENSRISRLRSARRWSTWSRRRRRSGGRRWVWNINLTEILLTIGWKYFSNSDDFLLDYSRASQKCQIFQRQDEESTISEGGLSEQNRVCHWKSSRSLWRNECYVEKCFVLHHQMIYFFFITKPATKQSIFMSSLETIVEKYISNIQD